MNELIFCIEALVIIAFALGALRLGKEALTAWVAIQALIANLFVLKQIPLVGLEVTASDSFIIGSLLGLNLLQEYYQQEDAKKATWICFFFMAFFVVVSQLHLLFQASVFDTSQPAFETLLKPAPRLVIASLVVFFLVQQFDIRFFAFLKQKLPQLSFSVRSGMSLVVSQFFDTVLFSFAGLYGIVVSIIDIILISFIIKLVVIFFFSICMRVRPKIKVVEDGKKM